MSEQPGILAIWNDCDPARADEYERWYRSEHLAERVEIAGFRFARRYEAIGGGGPQFFTYYEVDAPSVLVSPAYLERADHPTQWTRRIMGEALFRNLNRTVCRQAQVAGTIRGAFALTLRWNDARPFAASVASLTRSAAELLEAGMAVRMEMWERADVGAARKSAEQELRQGDDQSIAGALVIEAARDKELAEVSRMMTVGIGDDCAYGAYRLLCSLSRRDMGP